MEGAGLAPEEEFVEDEGDTPEDPELETEALLLDADLGDCCPQGKQDADADKRRRETAVRDGVQASHLQKDLNCLAKLREEKSLFIQKTREALRACGQHMGLLAKQQASVAAQVAAEREANHTAAVGRLQAMSTHRCAELESERDVQFKLMATLKESEKALWHIETQEGQLEGVQEVAGVQAEAAGRRLQVRAAEQLRKEKEARGKADRTQLLRVRKSAQLQKEVGLRHQKLLDDARKSHRQAVKFLKASLGRAQEQDRQRERESQEHMQRRMDAVLALKKNITASRETLRKFQAWGQAKRELAEQKAQAEKEAILAQGGDAFKHLVHQRRRQELEAQSRAFEEEQKLRKREIVSRILKEAAVEQSSGRRPRPAATAPDRLTLRDRTWGYIAGITDGKAGTAAPGSPVGEDGSIAHPQNAQLVQCVSSESVQGDPGNANWDTGTLAEPEIPGLWDHTCRSCQEPEEDVDRRPVGGTKMDKDILARTLERLRHGVVHKQVVSGHEFRGRPFNSKPELIHFKDFDVGKVYRKKITLVNATYTINYCKLVGVEEHLRDFIHIDFDPPGPLSAGMSCEVLVTFKPMINEDLEGSVSFLAQTGGFSVPLKCSTKKCSLSLDKELVDFGSYVVGETTSRIVTLTNVGGLGTTFKLLPGSEACDNTDISQSVLKMSSFFTYEDRGFYEKVTSYSEQHVEGHEHSPVDAHRGQDRGPPQGEESEVMRTIVTVPPSEEQTEISLGKVTEGEIGPFSSIKVPIIFSPVTPGDVQTTFKVVFKNQQCPTLHFRAVGVALDVPVWVPKPSVDLKICMYDRLYQDSVLIHTRSKAALRLRLEVCKELRGHVELLPETGYIQALSSYSVQLKFLPRHSLPEDAGKYFDKESRVLEAPMTIWVADQVKPVGFTVHAVVTTSDLELSPPELDFGCCTMYEAVRAPISLHNHSLLPQEFGFVRIPKFVDIQPNDGFGTILPLDTLELDVIFQPTKAKEYSFTLTCKSEINRCFKLTCRAVGVHPPLQLSHYQVKFAATSLYDTSLASLYVINSHVSVSSLTRCVCRVGSEDSCPVGPTSFQFLLPPDSPITISPSVGTVLPGKKCLVQVAFRPVLPSELIHQQAFQALTKDVEMRPPRKDTATHMATHRKDLRGPQSLSILQLQNQDQPSQRSTSHSLELQRQGLQSSSDEYQVAQATLARAFQGAFDKFVVPCVVARGDVRAQKGTGPLSFSTHHTLYLELWCPAVAPSVVVTSDRGKTVSNFGDVAVGHCRVKKVSIQNVCPEALAVEFSVLNPNGPFVLLNPTSKLPAGVTHVLALSFSPCESGQAQETLHIVTKKGTLSLTLIGTGVASMITCSIEGAVLNMGYVIARESTTSSFKLQNESSLPIKFSVQLDSLARTRGDAQQRLPRFLAASASAQRTEVVGTQNHSGQSVFSVAPVEGVLDPGVAQDFTVTFSPDHESLYFSDRLQVVLFEKKVSQQILLKGAAREHMMFVEGGDPLDVPVESLMVIPACDPEHREDTEELKPILLTLDYVQLDPDTPAPPATRELQVGCIRTTQPSPKKTVEFSLDSVAALQHQGFTVEPSRGFVERGQTKTISISWGPPAGFDPDHPLMVSALLQLKGDVKETYKVFFVAQVLTSL